MPNLPHCGHNKDFPQKIGSHFQVFIEKNELNAEKIVLQTGKQS